MIDVINYNLGHLTDFEGRDARRTFWWFVLFVVVVHFVVDLIASGPMILDIMGTTIDAARSGATQDEIEAQAMMQASGYMRSSMWIDIATDLLAMLALVAAFVRRLHDSNHSGWWADIPIATTLVGILFAISVMTDLRLVLDSADTAGAIAERQTRWIGYNIIGWIGPLVVIGFGLLRSTEGPNRFGDAPVRH